MFLFGAWQQTRCNVPAPAYLLSLLTNVVVLLIHSKY